MTEFAILNDLNRKRTPFGVVVHEVGQRPKWLSPTKQGMDVLKVIFSRETVYNNMPSQDGYGRVAKTWKDQDYLDFALVKVNLPLYISMRGRTDSIKDADDLLRYLEKKYCEGTEND